MRERDKIIEEKHHKELQALQRKVEKLRWTNNDTLKQLFDMQARALRLANSLGFKDLAEAQVCIDTADHELSYKECFEAAGILKAQLATARTRENNQQERIKLLNNENEELKTVLDVSRKEAFDKRNSDMLELQLHELQKRYDELFDTHERATAKFGSDYDTWRNFNAWLFSDDTHGSARIGSKKRLHASIMRKRRMVRDAFSGLGISAGDPGEKGCPPPLGGTTNPFQEFKGNKGLSGLNNTTPKASASSGHGLSLSPLPPATFKLNVVNGCHNMNTPSLQLDKVNMPSCSPTVFLSPPNGKTAGRDTVTSGVNKSTNLPDNIITIISDTEADNHGTLATANLPSSDTEEETQSFSQLYDFALPTPKSLPRPSTTKYRNVPAADETLEPPRKLRRVEAIAVPSMPEDFHGTLHDAPSVILNNPPGRQRTRSDSITSTRKRKRKDVNKENHFFSTPVNKKSHEKPPLQDYSAFKGRGRYADSKLTKTINNKYEIDSSRNGGLEYQYDEVVRRKDDRKKMAAGDCESCRDYYEAIGPLPPRLQPPLWCSPPKSEAKNKLVNCNDHKRHASNSIGIALGGSSKTISAPKKYNDSGEEGGSQFGISDGWSRQLEDHKKLISRHRHHWARGITPPGYWDIGFPDTQEAAKINKKAEEMHHKKQQDVERSIERDGRYRRRS
ncbi:hypothetical protein APHAL10511_004011 [Amanita phalloides]|nr:hypothetical protein APHAL10511_004011 [Amanita phalloides]